MTTIEPGCYLDSHRGHYAIRDMIQLAQGYGFIVDPFAEFAIGMYDDYSQDESYPQEALIELADEAENWLNGGQEDRVAGQNLPPIIPDGYAWGWNDGDFGLYEIESEDDGD